MSIISEKKKIMTPDGVIKSFDDFSISTKTVIAITNLNINLDSCFTYIPITDYVPIEKRRGRKKRIQIHVDPPQIPFGSVIMIQRKRDFRGTLLKPKTKKISTYFLHSLTIIIALKENKFVNMKISSNGKFQITGCKTNDHYEQSILAVLYIFNKAQDLSGEKIYSVMEPKIDETEPKEGCKTVTVIFNTVMQNLDFKLGFNICRYKLDNFINKNTTFCSIFEPAIGTGVNVKILMNPSENDLLKLTYNIDTKEIVKSGVNYQEYYNIIGYKELKKDDKKLKYHTFLIFASGSVIMSSRGADMKPTFNKLIDVLLTNKKHFQSTELPKIKRIKKIE
jgi:hypothetical protein